MAKNFVFQNEGGFCILKEKKVRSKKGESAFLPFPAAKSMKISVLAVMNKHKMFCDKIFETALTGGDFKTAKKKSKKNLTK